jgi:phosphinothricin acetyltransferase
MLTIKRATLVHLSAITEIYNEAILNTVATFDTEPRTIEEQKDWFVRHGSKYPILVAEVDGRAVGWASLSRWSDRCAYSDTAEDSLYVKEDCRGKGIGRKLLTSLIEEGKRAGLHTVIARITAGNEVSIRLHEDAGFQHVGIMKEVGRKFGRLLDVHLMQKLYHEPVKTT